MKTVQIVGHVFFQLILICGWHRFSLYIIVCLTIMNTNVQLKKECQLTGNLICLLLTKVRIKTWSEIIGININVMCKVAGLALFSWISSHFHIQNGETEHFPWTRQKGVTWTLVTLYLIFLSLQVLIKANVCSKCSQIYMDKLDRLHI